MHHGAQVIYDTDDDNELFMDANVLGNTLPHLDFAKTDRFFRQPEPNNTSHRTAAFNPYPAFGAPHAWPRGSPWKKFAHLWQHFAMLRPSQARTLVEEGLVLDVGIIQFLANHDLDVDAIHRLSPLPLPFTFSGEANDGVPIAVPHRGRLMSPYNAQATLHLRQAFWAMLLPISVHGRVSDIWQSFFGQRLFWETGLAVAFAAPWVAQVRNAHDNLADFEAEADLYERTAELLRYLSDEWACADGAGIDHCMLQLYLEMYRTGILELEDVKLTAAWLVDLRAIGYEFPKRAQGRDTASTNSDLRQI